MLVVYALNNEYSPWQWRKVRKEHIDLFGEKIKAGDSYLTAPASSAAGCVPFCWTAE